MPRQKLAKQFEPTSLEHILAGRIADDTSFEADATFTSEVLRPTSLQIREAGSGFNPGFTGEKNGETRFRLFDGTADDDPFRIELPALRRALKEVRTRIKDRRQNGLLPMQSDVNRLRGLERTLDEFWWRQFLERQ